MKTNLLKKIRKRYQIEKVTKCDSIISGFYEYRNELPIYFITDTYKTTNEGIVALNYNEAIERLIRLIRIDYKKRSKNKSPKNNLISKHKIWYNK